MNLAGQTVVVIGGSAGIGLETARLARAEGADVILTARNADRLSEVGRELEAQRQRPSTSPTSTALQRFFEELAGAGRPRPRHRPGPVLRAAGGLRLRRGAARRRGPPAAADRRSPGTRSEGCNAGGTLLFMGGTGGRRTAPGLSLIGALTAAMPALTKNLALEVAPIRVNLIAAGFVDTPLSASLLGDQLDARREQLRDTLPIRRVVGPADIASLAVHLMANSALTGATFDIDGGQQLV